MIRKKILKFLADFVKKPIVKVIIYLAFIVAILAFSGAFSKESNLLDTFFEILTSQDTLSLFFAGLFSIGVAKIISWFQKYMEESLKTEDNHHKIIFQYKGHKAGKTSYENSFADKVGVYLPLTHVMVPERPEGDDVTEQQIAKYELEIDKIRKSLYKHTHIKDKQSKEYLSHVERVERYLNRELCLCSLNMFTNIKGDTQIVFNDSNKSHELSPFIIAHADEILQAHKNSVTSNSDTVRLKNFDYDQKKKTLYLNTERSTYYHMLITNRCMDYQFANGMSIRDTYEYRNTISPLNESGLGNQIGINGLVVTNDHYILIEKRGHKKTTWKNKFAQSISLALKEKDLMLQPDGTIKNDPETAEQNLRKIIEKTLMDNFGLTPVDYDTFIIKENLLGLARDLLEGGKPNLYFYVKINLSAKELKVKLEQNVTKTKRDLEKEIEQNLNKTKQEQADENEQEKTTDDKTREKKDEKDLPAISSSKLDSDYYLVSFFDIGIDFNYRLFLNRKKALKICRKQASRCGKFKAWWDNLKATTARKFRPMLVRECGEALLVTLSFLELRWDWYQKNVLNKEKGGKKDEK